MDPKQRMLLILETLKTLYPSSQCTLNYHSSFQLLVATILSAQCTDKRVNLVTPQLFKKFPDPWKMAAASLEDIEKLIRSIGFYRNKALFLKEMSMDLIKRYQGNVPKQRSALIQLKGVGRKTANVILAEAFKIPALVVDTHVGRISRRLGFTQSQDPLKVEIDLNQFVPREDWIQYTHLLIDHGRKVCTARKADCTQCSLNPLCPKEGVSSIKK